MISVCLTTYNGERYVKLQLESILSQLPLDAEVIVADDCSSDRTLDIVRSFYDKRICVLPGEKRLGPVYNFERSLQAAKGDVIFLSDQDDVWLPGKVQHLLDALEYKDRIPKTEAPILAVHDATFIDSNGNELPRQMWLERPYKPGVFNNWLKNTYTGCCMAFRRELLQYALPFPKKLPMHDQWLGLLAERHFRVVAVRQPLIQYCLHENNATHLVGGKSSGIIQRLMWRLNLLKSLISAG